jgi:ppGpp synthetase/RelA/SpoT-type nucleotidyltranferase
MSLRAMNLKDYETEHISLYREFCETVRDILAKSISASGLPRPQSMQCRPKDPKTLRARLEQEGALGADNIESLRRDLAGARIIFYTDTDVQRFLGSRLIFNNFEVESGGVKIHHPTTENDEHQYRGIHYTIRLTDDRTKLPEYAKFKGLRCEVQVQTILHHAWSETSHDILYKNEAREGFGTRAMEAIESRFNRIMNRYLLPAGYEFQRVQHDYERLQQGKELFDRDLLSRLQEAADNNIRHEILLSLKQDVLPHYDDIGAIYGDVLPVVVEAAKKAHQTPVKPISTPLEVIAGKTAADVNMVVVEMIEAFRYVDIEASFKALRELYPHAK